MIPRNSVRWIVHAITLCLLIAGPACAPHAGKTAFGRSHRVAPGPIEIRPDEFLSHIAVLAHDEMRGRENGTEGIDLAAGYIAGRFAAAGIAPGGPDGGYFQEFPIEKEVELSDETTLAFKAADDSAVLFDDFIPFGFSATGSFSGDVVFAGYGITAPEKEYDDYVGLDVSGKVVLMLRREPSDLAKGRAYTRHARFDSKMELAAANGATAVLIVNQDPGDDGIDALRPFSEDSTTEKIPALHIRRDLAAKLLTAGGLESLEELQQALDDDHANVSAPLTGVRASGRVALSAPEIVGRNVIGVVEGSGPHADEYIVLGAHYDHMGTTDDEVQNGADDNASGTAGVIEACAALARTPSRDRGVICMAFAGEEIGLLGSEYFIDNPTVPVESVVAMLNFDMIGRLDHDEVENMLGIAGLGTGSSFKEIIERRAAAAGIDYYSEDTAKGPSDQHSFDAVGIPSLFFNTGMHYDLHQPTDDTEKINAEGGAQITQLAYGIAMDLINRNDAPVFAEVSGHMNFMRASDGVVMGVLPDTKDDPDTPGWSVEYVYPDSGAAKAGMKDGDCIMSIDGRKISGYADYKRATRAKKPGEVIAVTVRRGDNELTLDVELGARD